MAKKLYRTVVMIEILSDEPYHATDLENIRYDITDGHCSGMISDEIRNQELTGKEAVDKVKEQGTDIGFFDMDEEGNEIVLDDNEPF